MREILEVLSSCRKKGVSFAIDDSGRNLKVRGNIKTLSEEERESLRSNKEKILSLLQQSAMAYEPILPVGIQPSYELSSAQKRIWILSQLGGGELAYHITLTNIFEGQLDTHHLSGCLDSLIERHLILRTVFREDETGEIRQFVRNSRETGFSILHIDLQNEQDQTAALKRSVQQSRSIPFDLAEGPLLRACLYQLSDNKWVFDFIMHHIISDGWSMDILIGELLTSYKTRCQQITDPLPPLRIQYADYASWQQRQLAGAVFKQHEDYWLRQFEGELPVLNLPADKIRPPLKTYNGHSFSKRISADLVLELKALARQQDSTLFMGLLALVKILLYRYSGQKDIIVGSPIAGRDHPFLEDQVGLYMNTLALRTQFIDTDSFWDVLEKVKKTTLDAHAHQAYPFDALINALHLQIDRSRSPLFDVMMAIQHYEEKGNGIQPGMGGLRVAEYKIADTEQAKFDLFFNFIDREGELELTLVYNKDIYIQESIERMLLHLQQILAALLKAPAIPVGKLPYLNPMETRQLLVDFNNTQAQYPKDKTVVSLFEEQVLATPDAIALVFEDTRLTYKMLNEKAGQLAHYLLQCCCQPQPERLVAVMLDRSPEMIIAILAILKSGAAYVPIDPEYPPSRIEYMLTDSAADALITASHYLPDLAGYGKNIIAIDDVPSIPDISKDPFPVQILPSDLAYIIYTSGSTGNPKGVMISHESLVDYYFGVFRKTNICDCRHFGMVSTIAADLGNTVLYPALLSGGTLHIYSAAALLDAERIFDGQLDCIKIVPSHWNSLQGVNKTFLPEKCLIFGGEQLTPDILEKIKGTAHRCKIYNHYGPTETTVGKLLGLIDPDHFTQLIPLGSPFCHSAVYILDDLHQLTPVGVTGEICISGTGLARGYLNKPELTAEKFVPNPFAQDKKMYKTGDMGRWRQDGNIEFVGRKDDQVKIRGYRIELGEVETALRSHEEIEACVVSAKSIAGGEKELLAYMVCKTDLKTTDIRAYLGKTLPAYMIPTHFIRLERLPLTLNGKIDKRALPDPAGSALPTDTPYLAPRNEVESKLVSIWQEILGQKQIGIKDNFFESGGHSLKMMQLISRINRAFSVRLNIQSVFKEPDIENISEQIFFILDQSKQRQNKNNLKRFEI